MSDLNVLEFEDALKGAVAEFFDLMLSLEAEVEAAKPDMAQEERGFRAEALFEGELEGKIDILVGDSFARLMAASMLGIGLEEVDMESEVDDLLLEMANIVIGNLKTELQNQGFAIAPAAPVILNNIVLTPSFLKKSRRERLAFKHGEQVGFLDVSLRMPTETGPQEEVAATHSGGDSGRVADDQKDLEGDSGKKEGEAAGSVDADLGKNAEETVENREEKAAASQGSGDGGSETLSQDDITRMLAAAAGEGDVAETGEKKSATIVREEAGLESDDGGSLSQDAINSLLNGTGDEKGGADTAGNNGTGAEEQDVDAVAVEQDVPDKEGAPEKKEASEEEGTLSQDAINRLLAEVEEDEDVNADGREHTAEPDAERDETAGDRSEPPAEGAIPENEALSQDAISRLLAEADAMDSEDDNQEASPAADESVAPTAAVEAETQAGEDVAEATTGVEDETTGAKPETTAADGGGESQDDESSEGFATDPGSPDEPEEEAAPRAVDVPSGEAAGDNDQEDADREQARREEESEEDRVAGDGGDDRDARKDDEGEAYSSWKMQSGDDDQPENGTEPEPEEDEEEATFVLRKQDPPVQPVKKRSGKRRYAAVAIVLLLILAGGGGWYYWKTRMTPSPAELSQAEKVTAPMEDQQKKASPPDDTPEAEAPREETSPKDQPEDLSSHFVERKLPGLRQGIVDRVLEDRLAHAGNMRDELLIKREEIVRLKQYFADGIDALGSEVRDRKNKSGATSFNQAIKDYQLMLALQTIYRRRNTMAKLAEPIRWLELASEELHYMVRRTRMDLKFMPYTEGRSTRDLLGAMEKAIASYSPESKKLEVPPSAAPQNKQLAVIWESLFPLKKEAPPPPKTKTASPPASAKAPPAVKSVEPAARNEEIWAELCKGNFNRKSGLTAISREAATCLAKDGSKDIFLNSIDQLSPDAAAGLAKWKGEWLMLNGLKDLPAETAHNLSRWKGKRLSLNGLTTMSPEAVRKLTTWRGRQLELVGLDIRDKKLAGTIRRQLARWEKKGRKLYLSSKFNRAKGKKK